MIKTFKSKGLAELWRDGHTKQIDAQLHRRILRRLDRLDVAEQPEDMNTAGFQFHGLIGSNPKRYTVHVNGPWCITFEFADGHACNVDFENYH